MIEVTFIERDLFLVKITGDAHEELFGDHQPVLAHEALRRIIERALELHVSQDEDSPSDMDDGIPF